jgi:hypothetical protein
MPTSTPRRRRSERTYVLKKSSGSESRVSWSRSLSPMKPNSGWAPGVDRAVENLTPPRVLEDDDRAGRGAKALARDATTQSVTRESWTGFISMLDVALAHESCFGQLMDLFTTNDGMLTQELPRSRWLVSGVIRSTKDLGIAVLRIRETRQTSFM